jgi:hypothetical protein
MKTFARLVALCVALSPALALAQMQPPPAPPSGMPPPDFAAMKQMHDQMEAIHKKERAQVLSTLTASQRTLIANLVGGMTVAQNPDPKAAAAKVDAALSATQKSTILKIHQDAMSQSRDLMKKQMSQFKPPPGGGPPQQRQFYQNKKRTKPTAGQLVLRILSPDDGMHNFMFMRHGMTGRSRPNRMPPPSAMPSPAST